MSQQLTVTYEATTKLVPASQILAHPDLSLLAEHYLPVRFEEPEYEDPRLILQELIENEKEIQRCTQELLAMLDDLGYITEEQRQSWPQ